MPSKIKVHGILLVVAFIYGANYTIAKIAMDANLDPFAFILVRASSTAILFWVFSHFTLKEQIKDRADYIRLFFCGLFGVAANQLFFFKGLSMTNPIHGSIIMTTSPVTVIITAYLLGKESLTWKKIAGVLLGATGAFLLLTKNGISLEEGTFLGDLLVLANSTFYAIYLVLVKPLAAKYSSATISKWIFLIGSILILPFGLPAFNSTPWSEFPMAVWGSILFVILMATFTVYLLNNWAIKFVNSSVIGMYIYLQPMIATIIAIIFRGDKLDLLTVLYSLLIMGGVFLVSQKK